MIKVLTSREGVAILPSALPRMSDLEIMAIVGGDIPFDDIALAAYQAIAATPQSVAEREAGITIVPLPTEALMAEVKRIFEEPYPEWPFFA